MNRSALIRAFTAVELLVSIGVLSVLVGLSVPALSRSADSARRVTCGISLRTLHTGTTLGMDANGGLLPFADVPADFLDGSVEPFGALASTLDVPLPTLLDDEYERRDPWACDADDDEARLSGTSYRYAPMDFFAAYGTGERSRRQVSKLFLDNPDGVLFLDLLPFHGDGKGGRNAVRTAGHVDRLDERGLLPGVR